MPTDVDLVVTTFEPTYRTVLSGWDFSDHLKARYMQRPSGSATERLTPREWLRRKRDSAALLEIQASPWKPACCRHMPM